MSERKMFATRIDEELPRKLKHISADTDKTVAQLVEEATKKLCAKYREKSEEKNKR